MEKNYGNVLFKEELGVAYITLNDPANLNPVTVDVMRQLIECLNCCEKTNSVKAIVIRGEGGNFSAGGNVKKIKERLDNNINETKYGIRAGGEFIMRLKTICKPTIAWLEGAVAGVGISIAMACDFSIAAEECKLSFAFVNIGYVPDGGIVYMLSRAIGTVKTTDLLMSGKRFTGAEARDWGIITEAVPTDKLEETVLKYIEKYSHGPGIAYANIKGLINKSCYSELNACMQNEVEMQHQCSISNDHKEAINAFIEKRKPVFQGM